jgi:CHRD domain/PEP-CTERM motif
MKRSPEAKWLSQFAIRKMRRGGIATRLLMFLAFVFVAAVSGRADTIILTTSLSGPNEFPPNASAGTGTALVTYDTSAETLHVQVSFSGLSGTTTASHIHCCTATPFTGTAMVATTVPTFAGFPLGVTSGTYDNTLDLTMASSFNPSFVTAHGGTLAGAEAALAAGFLNGTTYLNIHTNVVPSGEIRGFLRPVPEPSTLFLLGSGLLGLTARARKKLFRKA